MHIKEDGRKGVVVEMNKEEFRILTERYQLVTGRIREIAEEAGLKESFRDYFQRMARFVLKAADVYEFIGSEEYENVSLQRLRTLNHELYEPALQDHYEESFLNPAYAVRLLGEDYGQQLSFLASELFAMIPCVYERRLFDLTIRMELLVEVYNAFLYAWEEQRQEPGKEEIRSILYWFVSDYQDVACERRIGEQLGVVESIAESIMLENDLTDLRFLYRYGEYVTEKEERLAEYLNSLSGEEITHMADTFTEGYRIGFAVTNQDIGKKKTVAIYYQLGFERVVKRAVENFEKMGLKTILYRNAVSTLEGKSLNRNGFYGAVCNRQYAYDHSEDQALYLDKPYVNRRLEALKNAYEIYKSEAAVYGGPAVIEVFGEVPFAPVSRVEACRLSAQQQKLLAEYTVSAGELVNRYIKGEERSFTIISFPTPDIGERFEEIFQETVRINTLDYSLYRDLQQLLIDALNQAEYVEVKGMNGNCTDLRVAIWELKDEGKETNFENCVADVNIPVGEVFTSPKLTGTNGVLHVKKVFLNELEYRDLKIVFQDGMTKEYGCGNFAKKEEGRKYVKDHVLYHHDALPLGEFAIGTNTAAYAMAHRFGIEDKLPILIAEKMGPHFALGDTCYSHAEEVRVFNPDGKEIVAKDNEVSRLRDTDPKAAYFNCHTDITIPYDELGELTVVKKDQGRIPLIAGGRFVLKGLESLNNPLKDL